MLKLKLSKDYNFNTNFIKPKDTLLPKIWKNDNLNIKVARKLTQIADEVMKSLELDVEAEDYVVTGSSASYNWHDMSDIDLHIMLDFNKIDDNFDLVKKMLDQIRLNWNKKHNIFINGKEVELYFQHYTEPHETSGMWSLMLEKWLVRPSKLDPQIDYKTVEIKAQAIAQSIDHLFEMFQDKKYKESYDYSGKIKKKIANMRSAGLAEDGIYSPENLAFKVLRNEGYLDKLSSLKIQSYDKMMSLNVESKKINENKIWKKYIKGGE